MWHNKICLHKFWFMKLKNNTKGVFHLPSLEIQGLFIIWKKYFKILILSYFLIIEVKNLI